MRILISGYHNPNFISMTEYIERAFSSRGHDLIVFNDRDHIFPGRLRDRFASLEAVSLAWLNRRLIRLAKRCQPDLVVVTGGHQMTSTGLRGLIGKGFRVVLWTTDPPQESDRIRKTVGNYNHVFCLGTEYIEIFNKMGFAGAQWLPVACDPEIHRPVELSPEEQSRYASDIVFMGSNYPCRADLLESLAGKDISIWGPGWERLPKDSPLKSHVRGTHTRPETWLKIYRASKIVLSIHYRDPKSMFPVYQASPRVFEALACKSFVLSDRQRDVLSLFKDGEHLVTFADADELKEKVAYYLAHPEQRERIAAAGQREVLRAHTYTRRIETLLETVGEVFPNRRRAAIGRGQVAVRSIGAG
jgi:spore maturation protein CgeB